MIQQYDRLISEEHYAETEIEYQEAILEGFEESAKVTREKIRFQEVELDNINDEIIKVELEWNKSHKCCCGLEKTENSCKHDKN